MSHSLWRRYAAVRPDVCQTDVDLAFLIDGSGSMVHPADYFSGQRRFVEDVIRYFAVQHDKTRIAALTYADNAVVNFGFAGDSPDSVEVCGSAGAVSLSQHLSGGYSNNVVCTVSASVLLRTCLDPVRRWTMLQLHSASSGCRHAHANRHAQLTRTPEPLSDRWLTSVRREPRSLDRFRNNAVSKGLVVAQGRG